MSFGFVPSGPGAEASVHADAEARADDLRRTRRPTAAAFDGRSARGSGSLLVAADMVSFHPRHGADFLHTQSEVKVENSGLATRVLLHGETDTLTVSVHRWRRGRLIRALRAVGLAVS